MGRRFSHVWLSIAREKWPSGFRKNDAKTKTKKIFVGLPTGDLLRARSGNRTATLSFAGSVLVPGNAIMKGNPVARVLWSDCR